MRVTYVNVRQKSMVRAPKNMAAIVTAIVMNLPGMTLQPLYWHINIYKHQMGAFQVENRVVCVCVCVCACVCVCVCVCVHNKATRICHIHLRISSFCDVSYTLIADIRCHYYVRLL